MAKLDSLFPFTGSLGNVSAYTMRGHDKIILRSKGGATKHMIKTAPQFQLTRNINAEFGGRSKAGRLVVLAMYPMKALADYNLSGPINALLKPAQVLDTEHEYGKRSILLSQYPSLLSGFQLNRQYPFDSIVQTPINYTIDSELLSADLQVPAMVPGINFRVPGRYAYFGIVAALGIVPDLYMGAQGYAPDPAGNSWPHAVVQQSEWYPVSKGAPAIDINLQQVPPPAEGYTLLLSIGIRFGAPGAGTDIEQVKWAGAAKVLEAVGVLRA